MIPKVIHYCWFGGKNKPKLIKDCISSWKLHLPDYEIKEWNEFNSDLTPSFVQDAYQLKKWAFVADFIRLEVLYENGGIYLDTDMMLLKNFDDFLNSKGFIGVENRTSISCGVIGAEIHHPFIKKCLDYYSVINLTGSTDLRTILIPLIVTKTFREEYNFHGNFDDILILRNLTVYPKDYFYPFPFKNASDLVNYKDYIKPNTYAVHLWNASWLVHSASYYFKRREYNKFVFKIFRSLVKDKKVILKYLNFILNKNRDHMKRK